MISPRRQIMSILSILTNPLLLVLSVPPRGQHPSPFQNLKNRRATTNHAILQTSPLSDIRLGLAQPVDQIGIVPSGAPQHAGVSTQVGSSLTPDPETRVTSRTTKHGELGQTKSNRLGLTIGSVVTPWASLASWQLRIFWPMSLSHDSTGTSQPLCVLRCLGDRPRTAPSVRLFPE